MQDRVCGFPRINLLGDWVNRPAARGATLPEPPHPLGANLVRLLKAYQGSVAKADIEDKGVLGNLVNKGRGVTASALTLLTQRACLVARRRCRF